MREIIRPPARDQIDLLVENMVSAWNGQDLRQLLECFAEDLYWDDPGMAPNRPVRGKASLKVFALSMWRTCPDLKYMVLEPPYISSDSCSGKIALHWMMTGTMLGPLDPPGFSPTRKSFKIDGVDLVQFDDGKIVHIDTRFDLMDMIQQIGILPAIPVPGSWKERLIIWFQRLVAWIIRRKTTRMGSIK